MRTMALLLLRFGLLLTAAGVVLRLMGFHQAQGFLQPPLAHGITPRAFLLAGMGCAVFSIAIGVLEICRQLDGKCCETKAIDHTDNDES